MLSRRTFVRVGLWGSGALFVGGLVPTEVRSSRSPSAEAGEAFDHYVSNLDQEAASAVELIDWNGRTKEQRALLTWRTRYERNNRGFVVQHRREKAEEPSASWATHGFVAGHGTTGEPQAYRYVAGDLALGTHEFRLKQVGTEGRADHSDPVTVTVGMTTAVRVAPPRPTPAQARVTVSFAVREEQEVTLALYDVLGRRVRTVYRDTPPPERKQSVQVDVSGLAAGTYFLRLRAGTHVETHRCPVVQ